MESAQGVQVAVSKPIDALRDNRISCRVASIDWMRGVVMVFTVPRQLFHAIRRRPPR
jgi:hypothetical protein